MAKVKANLPEEYLERLSKLGAKTDEISGKVLEAGAAVVRRYTESNLRAVVGKDTKYESRSTGQLVSSLGVTKPGVDDKGNYNIKVGFSEKRTDGKVNAMLANVLEYGKAGQPAKPFLARAKKQSKKPCLDAMIQAFESEVGKV